MISMQYNMIKYSITYEKLLTEAQSAHFANVGFHLLESDEMMKH